MSTLKTGGKVRQNPPETNFPSGLKNRVHVSVSTFYLYAGSTLIAEVNASGGLVRSYTWGAAGLVSDYTPNGAEKHRAYVFDGLGNTIALLGENGSVLGVAEFGAWGKTLYSSLPQTPFGWKGQAEQWMHSRCQQEARALLDGKRGLLASSYSLLSAPCFQ